LPFFLLAPGSFIRDVLSPLSYIPVASRVSISARLGELTGVFRVWRQRSGGDCRHRRAHRNRDRGLRVASAQEAIAT